MSDAHSQVPASDVANSRGFSRGHAWLIGALAAAIVLFALSGDSARLLLRYERSAVLHGELWRLITAHLVHGNPWHCTLNLAGMGLAAMLFGRDYSPLQWLGILFLSALVIDAGFVFYEPQLQWYVGLSGVLHGAIAAGLIAWWGYENRVLTLTFGILVMAKLFWEQNRGALPFSGDMPVIVDAHLYGALGGVSGAFIVRLVQRHWPRRP